MLQVIEESMAAHRLSGVTVVAAQDIISKAKRCFER